jgi:hypothetical protein
MLVFRFNSLTMVLINALAALAAGVLACAAGALGATSPGAPLLPRGFAPVQSEEFRWTVMR